MTLTEAQDQLSELVELATNYKPATIVVPRDLFLRLYVAWGVAVLKEMRDDEQHR